MTLAIVVAVDLTEMSDTVLHHAFEQALVCPDPTLHVVMVIQDPRSIWKRARRATLGPVQDHALGELSAVVARCLADGVREELRATWSLRLHVLVGRPEEELASFAADVGATMLVVGRHEGVGRLTERADCPVLVVARPRTAVISVPDEYEAWFKEDDGLAAG